MIIIHFSADSTYSSTSGLFTLSQLWSSIITWNWWTNQKAAQRWQYSQLCRYSMGNDERSFSTSWPNLTNFWGPNWREKKFVHLRPNSPSSKNLELVRDFPGWGHCSWSRWQNKVDPCQIRGRVTRQIAAWTRLHRQCQFDTRVPTHRHHRGPWDGIQARE